MNSELIHYGVLGMKWGVRRYRNKTKDSTDFGNDKTSRKEKKAAKKEVNILSRGLARSGQNTNLASAAAYAKIDPKDYKQAAELVKQGRVFVKARFEKNYKDRSVDVYFDNDKNPTIRTRLQKGNTFSAEFLDDADKIRYEDFVKYLRE